MELSSISKRTYILDGTKSTLTIVYGTIEPSRLNVSEITIWIGSMALLQLAVALVGVFVLSSVQVAMVNRLLGLVSAYEYSLS
jgi:hypothetical protein